MNLSAKPVQAVLSVPINPLKKFLVIHDDFDIPPGTAKLKKGGGHGGHND